MSASSRPVPKGYGGSARKARQQGKRMDSKQDKTPLAFPNPHGPNGVGAGGVPGYYLPPDDDYINHHPREQYTAGRGSATQNHDGQTDPNAEAYDGFKRDLKKSDIKRWEKRREIMGQIKYDQWLARRFDIADPHVARWLRKIEPEFWARRQAYMNDKMNVEAFLTRMRLYGPQTIEDIEGIYALRNDAALVDSGYRPSAAHQPADKFRYTKGRFAVGDRLRENDSSADLSYMQATDFA